MTPEAPLSARFDETMAENLIQNSHSHWDLGQEIIHTTEDKVRLSLHRYISRLLARERWVAPVSLLCTVSAVLFTSTFKERFGLPASTWEALFILIAVGSGIWSVVSVIQAIRARVTEDDFISEFKKTSREVAKP